MRGKIYRELHLLLLRERNEVERKFFWGRKKRGAVNPPVVILFVRILRADLVAVCHRETMRLPCLRSSRRVL